MVATSDDRNRHTGVAVPVEPGVSTTFTFSLETFDDCVAREFCRPPDQILRALAGDSRVTSLTVVDPWRSRVVDLARGRGTRLVGRDHVDGRPVVRLRPRRLRLEEPTSPRSLRVGYARLGRIMAAHAGPGERSTALVTVNPFVAAWASDGFDRCIYFGRDDWASFPPQRPWWDAYRAAYAAIADTCDHVFVVSETLAERVAPGRARVIPNGVDVRRWSATHVPSSHLDGMVRPIGIYAGTVDERIDLDVIRAFGSVLGSVAVAGPWADATVADRLREMPGVRLLGTLGQDELVRAIRSADVGLLPHADTPLTRAMSPLKLYEYLAGGLPVVATDLPPVRGEGPRVLRCSSIDDWPTALRAAISLPRLTESERRRTVDSLSWSTRLQPLRDAVAGV